MKLSSNAASPSVSITSSSAPSASAPSWCGGNRSALSSTLSRIPAAEIMTPNRPPASPAAVVLARPVPLAELPRVRKREDLRQNQTVMAAMAEIVEEHLSQHRRPSRTRIPVLCRTSATLIKQEEAGHFRMHSTVQTGTTRAGDACRNITFNCDSREQTRSDASKSRQQQARASRVAEIASNAERASNVQRDNMLYEARKFSRGTNPSLFGRAPGSRLLSTPITSSTSSSRQSSVEGQLIVLNSANALMYQAITQRREQNRTGNMKQILATLANTAAPTRYEVAVFGALVLGGIAIVLASAPCGFCWDHV